MYSFLYVLIDGEMSLAFMQRLSEMCCFAVTQLLMLGKSIISNTNRDKNDDDMDVGNIEWPEDSLEKAKIIRIKAQLMTVYAEAISRSFITGWYLLHCFSICYLVYRFRETLGILFCQYFFDLPYHLEAR